MHPHRPPGKRPAAHAHPVRSNPHVHSHREAKKPSQAIPVPKLHARLKLGLKPRDRWPVWTADSIVTDSLPPAEAAIVDAIDRMARPVTAGELSTHCWEVRKLTRRERDAALRGLVRRGVLISETWTKPHPGLKPADPSALVLFGFPEHFEDAEGGDDVHPL